MNEEKFFDRFIEDSGWNPCPKQPFYRDGYVYATNRMVLVRVPYKDLTRLYEPDKVIKTLPTFPEPTCSLNLPISTIIDILKSIPAIEEVRVEGKDAECDECEGSGSVEWTYEDSDGEEHFEHFDCPICKGMGKVKTKKFYRELRFTSINGVAFRNNELKILAEAANDLGLNTIEVVQLPDSCSAARFHLEPNIDIIIMAAVNVKIDRTIKLEMMEN